MASEALRKILEMAKRQKHLGSVPIQSHIDNAEGFVQILESIGAQKIVDLGSGGGVPGLIIAEELPETSITLIERGAKRADFLNNAVNELDLTKRIRVIPKSAEAAARWIGIEETADAVTSRSFGPPAVTAECACRILKPCGALIVSEPPFDQMNLHHSTNARWPAAHLAPTGLEPSEIVECGESSFQVLIRKHHYDPRLPRSDRATRKRPLF